MGKTLSFVPKLRSFVRVKYQGQFLKKMAVKGALVFHKHSLFKFGKHLAWVVADSH